MSRWVLVDDTDSGIHYSGPWFQDQGSQNGFGNFGPPYESTLHGINSNGSFLYSFEGTKVLVTGTVQFPAASASSTSNPSWVCMVDGATIPTNTYTIAENRLDLCETDSLTDSEHTITVQATSSDQHTFWVDYIQYFPSASADLDGANLLIDFTDTQIKYGVGWVQHSPGLITSQTGSTVSFTFEGVSLTWLGFYDNDLPLSPTTATYSIDDGESVMFNLNGTRAQDINRFNQILFQTPQLSLGNHTIQLVYQGNSQTAPLSLIDLEIQGGGPSLDTSLPSISLASSAWTAQASTSSITDDVSASLGLSSSAPEIHITSVPSPASTSSAFNSSFKSGSLRSIIGGIAGGLALFFVLLFLFLFLRARYRSRARQYIVVNPFRPDFNPSTQTRVAGKGLMIDPSSQPRPLDHTTSADFLYPQRVRDKDSRLRFSQRVERGQVVDAMPPDYTPT